MDLATLARLITAADLAALGLTLAGWLAIGWRIEHPGRVSSVTVLMAEVRREWMRQFLARDNRIFDSQLLGSLRQGTSYLASTALLALGALLAVIGNPAPLVDVAEGLAHAEASAQVWQLRLLLPALFLAHAFLKFVWAHRVFGYCAVMMGAVPNDPADPHAAPRAAQAAELNIRAAWNFNRGLRSMYFALAALAWLAGPLALALADLAVLWTLWSREFRSVPRDVLSHRR